MRTKRAVAAWAVAGLLGGALTVVAATPALGRHSVQNGLAAAAVSMGAQNPRVQAGDRARVEVEGIGFVENPVIDWSEVADDDEPAAGDAAADARERG